VVVAAAASIHHDSLRVLEWDKLSDLVSSFATTSLGRHALKVTLSFLPFLYSILCKNNKKSTLFGLMVDNGMEHKFHSIVWIFHEEVVFHPIPYIVTC
jgi:hypothetical protein